MSPFKSILLLSTLRLSPDSRANTLSLVFAFRTSVRTFDVDPFITGAKSCTYILGTIPKRFCWISYNNGAAISTKRYGESGLPSRISDDSVCSTS